MYRRRIKHSDGVAALEFGLVVPILMVLLMAIIDYGQVYFVRLTMTNAAREGARIGATMNAEDAAAAAVNRAQTYLQNAGIHATVTATSPSDTAPEVQVSITLSPYEPLVGLVPTPGELRVSATMRWELARPEP